MLKVRGHWLSPVDCNSGERGNDHSCEGELGNLTFAALKVFQEGTGMLDVDAAHLLAMWQTQMSALAYSADGWNSRTLCVVSMNPLEDPDFCESRIYKKR
jgi:hypothetical protein